MKTKQKTIGILLLSLVFTISFTACKDVKSTDSNEKMEHTEMQGDGHEHSSEEMTNNHAMQTTESAAIIDGYLQLKNALVADDGTGASKATEKLLTAFQNFDADRLTPAQQKEIADIIEDATTQAEHIVENADKIAHQREHFVLLSKDVIDFISLTGTDEKLYQDFCSMADDNKGAVWLSETKGIKNPYLGSKMLSCGTVQKEF